MKGTQTAPAQLFYDFDMERHVPSGHMLREIDRFLDVDGMREAFRPFYSHLGRPSIDPELIIRMLVIGYVMSMRSERRLCDEVHLNPTRKHASSHAHAAKPRLTRYPETSVRRWRCS